MIRRLFLSVALLLLPAWASAQAQMPYRQIEGGWKGGFERRGPDNLVRSFCVYDDGSGPALYVGGIFGIAGGVASWGIARWSGTQWEDVGSLNPAADVCDMAVVSDGTRDVLVIVGNFSSVGGVSAQRIATWNGTEWKELGGGIPGSPTELTTGSGPLSDVLYVAGSFTTVGDGFPANNVVRWDAENGWIALGGGIPKAVSSISFYKEALFAGTGPNAQGTFPTVQRFDGQEWTGTTSFPNAVVSTLFEFDDGSGAGKRLFAGGSFTDVGATPAYGIAAFDGASWSAVGPAETLGTQADPPSVRDLTARTGPAGPELVAVGNLPGDPLGTEFRNVAVWDGTSWSAVGNTVVGTNNLVITALSADLGSGEELFVGGTFALAGEARAAHAASWDGTQWSAFGQGAGLPAVVSDFTFFDDGTDSYFYLGGNLGSLGGVARWNVDDWEVFGGGVDDDVADFTVWDDGTGPALYVAGRFDTAGGQPANGIARWDGTTWDGLGTSALGNAIGITLEVHDDGGGEALYVGGSFSSLGGVAAENIARWDGTSWSAVGGGLGTIGSVADLAVFDDGNGPTLYAAGSFRTGSISYLAYWRGGVWSELDDGPTSSFAWRLFPVDHPSFGGKVLIVGGIFLSAGGVPARGIARWTPGSGWSAFGAGLANGGPFALLDTPTGPELVAGGSYQNNCGCYPGLARWNGQRWVPLGGGLGGTFTPFDVGALQTFEIDGVQELWVGGDFDFTGGAPTGNLNVWLQAPMRR